MRNAFFAWGVAPTILALLGLAEQDGLDGRVLHEALAGGPDEKAIAVETRVHAVVSVVDGRRYWTSAGAFRLPDHRAARRSDGDGQAASA